MLTRMFADAEAIVGSDLSKCAWLLASECADGDSTRVGHCSLPCRDLLVLVIVVVVVSAERIFNCD